MNRDDPVYVAGHQGLVGSALLRLLQAQGYRNLLTRTPAELDLTRQEPVERFFASQRPAYVFLAAARVGGIGANASLPAQFIYDNLAIALNVIHAAWRHGARRLLNLGSSCIYPRLAPQPLKEEYLLSGPLEPTNEAYAVAKIAAIRLCRHYNQQYGTSFFSLMPTNLYGPNDNFDLQSAHVLPALLRKLHLAALLERGDFRGIRADLNRRARPGGGPAPAEEPDGETARRLEGYGILPGQVTLWGTGRPLREFLHVDDLAEACLLLMRRPGLPAGDFLNAGSGHELAIAELAELVRGIVGYEGRILFDPARPDGTPRKLLDSSRLRELGWSPRLDLPEGIARTYRWYNGESGDAGGAR
jgi:GDP-L-fucose synthase